MQAAAVLVAAVLVLVVSGLWSRRSGIATPLIALALGILIGFTPVVPDFQLKPEWVLGGVLPPLLYASSVRLPVLDLRRNRFGIAWLSVALVVASALVVGWFVHLVIPGIPAAAGVAFGAVVSPTDAVAATSIGKRLGLPNRLMVVLEGESMFNDATALVLMRTAVVALAGAFSFSDALWTFTASVAIAVVLGYVVGLVTVWWRGRLNDPILNTAVSFAVPFIAYLPTEALGASGVVAVVVAGVVTGHRSVRHFSARERVSEQVNWATLQFLIENGLFLAMGLELHHLAERLPGHGTWGQLGVLVGGSLAVLLLLRAVFVAVQVGIAGHLRGGLDDRRTAIEASADKLRSAGPGSSWFEAQRASRTKRNLRRGRADLDFEDREPITRRSGIALVWAGMRGVLTLAAALSLPLDLPHRTLLVTAAFGVAVVSLLVYGPTLPLVIRWLKLPPDDPEEQQSELSQLMGRLTAAGVEALDPATLRIDGEPVDPDLVERVRKRYSRLNRARMGQAERKPTTDQQIRIVQRAYLSAMRAALTSEQRIGAFSSGVLKRAQTLVDAEEIRLDR